MTSFHHQNTHHILVTGSDMSIGFQCLNLCVMMLFVVMLFVMKLFVMMLFVMMLFVCVRVCVLPPYKLFQLPTTFSRCQQIPVTSVCISPSGLLLAPFSLDHAILFSAVTDAISVMPIKWPVRAAQKSLLIYYLLLYDSFVRGLQAHNVCHPLMVTNRTGRRRERNATKI